jgi:hypothetical protein
MKISSLFSSAKQENKCNKLIKRMDLIIFERKAFEEFATKIEQFILRVSNSPVVKNGKKKTNNWLDHQDVCQRLKISKRTLQTLRDNGTLAYTKIGNRTYYLPEDVESIVTKVEDRRKEAKWKGREI